MTIRNLEKLFSPKSVALIGASAEPRTIGGMVARNLVGGGFEGRIDFVNPKRGEIEGRTCVAHVSEIAEAPDLAVIATPPHTIPGIAAELAACGTRAAVVISAGVTPDLKQAMLDAGRASFVRVLGPNCIGLLRPSIGLNASFAHRTTKAGSLALLSQSGALVTAVIDWAAGRDVGFSHIVSLGDMADVDFGDILDYLVGDPSCSAILLYIEAITHPQKFMTAARRAARVKPVIAIKAGRHAAAAKAAFSHTGSLAGSDAAYTAAFRRAGILRVNELGGLFAAAQMIADVPTIDGERLAILTNGGGAGVLAADALADNDGVLATLSGETIAALDAVLPKTWSKSNPVDIIGDAGAERYGKALDILLADRSSDAVLVLNCPTGLASSTDIAREVIAAKKRRPRKPILTNWLGVGAAEESRRLFAETRIPTFFTPTAAVDGFMNLVRHQRAQEQLSRTPPPADDTHPVDRAAADRVISAALAEGRTTLSEAEGKQLLAAYGIPVVPTHVVATPKEAAERAADILATDSSVALKILSYDLTHKSDIGGVRLGLDTPGAVERAANDMLDRIKASHPTARITGFTVSAFVKRPRAHELILGITEDQTFGPLILFGAGGTSAEVLADTALALPPLDMALAHDVISQTRISRLLAGYRSRPRVDLDAIANALVRLSALAVNHEEIREFDVNPLIADDNGVIALDARVRIADPVKTPRAPVSIKPYPSKWQFKHEVKQVGAVLIRPIRPEDASLYPDFFDKVTMNDRRLRLFTPMKHLPQGFVARLTQIDYARDIAFVAISEATGELLGVVRYFAEPDFREAEYAVLVRSDLKGLGLGLKLMNVLIMYAQVEGLPVITGTILNENTAMIDMVKRLGFETHTSSDDPGVTHVRLDLKAIPETRD